MIKEKLRVLFDELKEICELDYAVVDTDMYGDCTTCVNYELIQQYGLNSKGIFLKHWEYGMNAEKPLEEIDWAFIAHDLTHEQGVKMFNYLNERVTLENTSYNPRETFIIKLPF